MQQKSFHLFLKEQLNEQQTKAVKQKSGALLVVAGAGSGKTRVITARIANLILNEKVPGQRIVALTFTNKAAMEMKERINRFLGNTDSLPFIGTFHSYCLKLLKTHTHVSGDNSFSIIDEDDKQKILNTIIITHGLKKQVTARQLSYRISDVKNKTTDPKEHEAFAIDPLFAQIYQAYEQEKKNSKCLDFDDLLVETLQLFSKDQVFKERFQERISHVLVDEYQDTNVVQHSLLRYMTQNEKGKLVIDSVCVVGDEDQSIYSWRGATVANIGNFTRDFNKTKIIKIEQNYRSVDSILKVANTLIKHNNNRNEKKLWSTRKGSDRVRILAHRSGYQEAESIAYLIKLFQQKNTDKKIAILYRTHFQSRALEEALIKNSLAYKIIGGVQFYERKEIKDILAYLRLIVNPFDHVSFFRVVNTPSRGLGAKFEELFRTYWNNEPFLNFKQIAVKLLEQKKVVKSKAEKLSGFVEIFSKINLATPVSTAIEKIITATRYITHIKDAYDHEEAQSRIENVNELINSVQHIETKQTITIDSFLHEVALMQAKQDEKNENNNPALLMTLHAAKGLEFNTVVIAGLEEGLLPSGQSQHSLESIEEERRLFYVGITRAKDRLLLSHAHSRHRYGSIDDQSPSRFLHEIPTRLAHSYDATRWSTLQCDTFFSMWLGIRKSTNLFSAVHTFGTSTKTKKARAYKTTKKTYTPRFKTTTKTFGGWKKNQAVQHKTFGIGLIQKIEKKGPSKTFVTVKFKIGIKRIDKTFLTQI